MSRALTGSERDTTLSLADDEDHWTVFTDSGRYTRRLLAVADRWGVTPQRCGEGCEFTLPLKAVRFVGPRRVSERQRAASRASIQKAQFALRSPVKIQAAEGVAPPASGEIPAQPARPPAPPNLDAPEPPGEEDRP